MAPTVLQWREHSAMKLSANPDPATAAALALPPGTITAALLQWWWRTKSRLHIAAGICSKSDAI
jgi:hypothetical protein